MLLVEPHPNWPDGTDLKIVYDWMYPRYCLWCFMDICDQCDGTNDVVDDLTLEPHGYMCHCLRLHEHEYWSIE